jgi:2-methylfumaryl-CoA isomerase
MVVALTRRHWASLIAATGLGDEIGEMEQRLRADLSEEGNRFRHREPILELLQGWFSAHDFEEVSSALGRHHALWGPYQTFKEMLAVDPRSRPGGLLETVDQPGLGPHLVAGSPLRFGAVGAVSPGPAPSLGQHTEQILQERLELSASELAGLRRAGVIA